MLYHFFKSTLRVIVALVVIVALIGLYVYQPIVFQPEYKNPVADSERLKKHVITLSEKLHQETDYNQLNAKKSLYIFHELSKYSESVHYQDYKVDGVTHRNVIANFPSETKCGAYIIGAHYDTYNDFPGADDNASGVAGVIELARLFSTSNLPCGITLIAYALEEPPFFKTTEMGSYIHASSLYESAIEVELMISLEMIGHFSDIPNSQNYPVKGMNLLYPDRGNYISVIGNTAQISLTRFYKKHMGKFSKLPVFSMNAPSALQGIDYSDHSNYWHYDYPAIMITDTAFNRNKYYHTSKDTWEKLDYTRMSMVIDGVYYATLAYMSKR